MNPKLERIVEKVKATRWLRNTAGVFLIAGGLLGPIMPILGVWMLPLGLVLLAVDFPWAQRLHDRLHAWWDRRKRQYRRWQKR